MPRRTTFLLNGAAALALALGAGVALAGQAQAVSATTPAGTPAVRHVVLAGLSGLRWSDVSPSATPALWRLAMAGSPGSLVDSGVAMRTCPASGWLTLNAGARAAVPAQPATGPCPAMPAVVRAQAQPGQAAPTGAGQAARVPALPQIVRYNAAHYSYAPAWGMLAAATGGRCATAAGPGAALALADRDGRVASYLPSVADLTPGVLARCPLTVADLGAVPAGAGPAARAAWVHAADARLARLAADLPPSTLLIVAAPGDGLLPHLHVIVASGPGFRAGQLASPSTRQPGLTLLTDVTPTVLRALGRPIPAAAAGFPLDRAGRAAGPAGLAAAVRGLGGQDVAAVVYRGTVTAFFQILGFGLPLAFALILLVPWGRGAAGRRRRVAAGRIAGIAAASLPAGTFLASLSPWQASAHPAAVLYAAAVAWAAVIAAAALAGPWRRDPLGPPGAVGAVTLAVVGLDLMTGSHLQPETPFGISFLEAGRFYGLGNNGVVLFAASALLCAAWLGGALLRRTGRRRALLVMAGVAAFAVVAAGWPGFGAKVGGTIAMVPAFGVLLAAAAGTRINARRAVLIGASGLLVVIVFALVSYFIPATGAASDISAFVGRALHGGAGSILARKASSNIGSLGANPFIPVIPVVLAVLGVAAFWPATFHASLVVRGYREIPLLKAAFGAIWLVAVLGWLAEDSGVTVPAAAFPLVLPLVVAILCAVAARPDVPVSPAGRGPGGGDHTGSAASRSGEAGYL